MLAAFALSILAPVSQLEPVTVELRFDRHTQTVELWQGSELHAEYEPLDGDIYRDLLGVLREGQGRSAPNPLLVRKAGQDARGRERLKGERPFPFSHVPGSTSHG